MREKELSGSIVDSAIEVHRHLGPGLLEQTYKHALILELQGKGLSVLSEVGIPVVYKSTDLGIGYRLDLLVEHTVIVELKSVIEVLPIHTAQLLTYLRLSNLKIGLLLNFNTRLMKDGICRMKI